MPDNPPDPKLQELQRRWKANPASRLFLQLAEEHRRRGELEDALAVLREGNGSSPSVAGQVALGRCLLEAGDVEAAREELEAAIARDATQMVAYRHLIEVNLQMGDAAEARRCLDVYHQLNASDADLPALEERYQEVAAAPAPSTVADPRDDAASFASADLSADFGEPDESPDLSADFGEPAEFQDLTDDDAISVEALGFAVEPDTETVEAEESGDSAEPVRAAETAAAEPPPVPPWPSGARDELQRSSLEQDTVFVLEDEPSPPSGGVADGQVLGAPLVGPGSSPPPTRRDPAAPPPETESGSASALAPDPVGTAWKEALEGTPPAALPRRAEGDPVFPLDRPEPPSFDLQDLPSRPLRHPMRDAGSESAPSAPIATATLERLYQSQGHHDEAARIASRMQGDVPGDDRGELPPGSEPSAPLGVLDFVPLRRLEAEQDDAGRRRAVIEAYLQTILRWKQHVS